MSIINPVQASANGNISFRSIKNSLESKKAMQKMTKEVMERAAGAACAASTKDPAVIKEIILKESILGHFDFVKGITDYIKNNASKNLYK